MIADWNKLVHHLRQHGYRQQQNASFIQQIKKLFRLGTPCEIIDKIPDLEPVRQGPTLAMSLESKTLDAILKLDDKDI